MRAFKGYVSPSREGILSDRPDAAGHDRTTPDFLLAGGHAPDRVRIDTAARLADEGQTAGEHVGERDSGPEPQVDRVMQAVPSLPVSGTETPRPARRWFTPRVLAAAIVVNAVLIAFLAFIMHLDRPKRPQEIYVIELTDRPAETAGEAAPESAGGTGQATGHK